MNDELSRKISEYTYKDDVKRIIDIVLASVGLGFAAIPMLVVAILIKKDTPGPVFFLQKRIGKNKKYFYIIKFRSMPVSAPKDTPTHELKNAKAMLTPFQEMIRKYSIDELPQLFNIFFGDMSFVGPRPALWNQTDLIEERDKYGANDVCPGLTGWAQINGRDELPIEVKAAYDGEYVKNLSFWFDLKCFAGTFLKVLKADGVVEGGTGAVSDAPKDSEL